MFTSARAALAVVAVCGLVGFAGCSADVSTGKTVNTEEGEKQISAGLTEQLGGKVTVDCPEDVKAEAGKTFDCEATSAEGETATVVVTQKDDDGNISWEIAE